MWAAASIKCPSSVLEKLHFSAGSDLDALDVLGGGGAVHYAIGAGHEEAVTTLVKLGMLYRVYSTFFLSL